MGQSLRKVNMNTYKLELGAITVMLPKLNFWDKILYTYSSFWLNLLGQHFLYPSGSPYISQYAKSIVDMKSFIKIKTN